MSSCAAGLIQLQKWQTYDYDLASGEARSGGKARVRVRASYEDFERSALPYGARTTAMNSC